MEKEMERWRVFEYRRTAATATGVVKASPIAKGINPPVRANHFRLVKTITVRATRQTVTPKKKVFRSPIASVSEPTNKVKDVIKSDQPATKPKAFSSL